MAGVPHTLDGYVVLVGARRYIVVDECAGLTYVTLAAFLGYCFALLMHRSFVKALGMALAGGLLGVVSNVIRVNAIVLIDWMRGSQLDLTAHGTVQWIMLLAVLGGLMVMLARSRIAMPPRPLAPAVPQGHRARLRWTPALAAAAAPLIVAMLAARGSHEPTPVLATEVFPAQLAGWTRLAPAERTPLAPSTRAHMMHARYRREDRTLQLSVIEALADDAKLPESVLAPGERALWREKQVTSETACAGTECVTLRHATWQREKSPDLRHVYLVYSVGTFTTDSRFSARVAHGWHRLLGDSQPSRLSAISVDAPLPGDQLEHVMREMHTAMAGAETLQMAGAH
jgi:exosortase/archaeosortase family protein